MKKRILCAVLASLMVLTMTACGSSKEGSESGSDSKKTEKAAKKVEYSLEETVVADTDNYKISVTGAENDGEGGLILKLTYENRSDVSHHVRTSNCYINGYNTYGSLEGENNDETAENADPIFGLPLVSAGTSVNYTISFSSKSLINNDIPSADEVAFQLSICDEKMYTTYDQGEIYTVYPTGLSADEIISPERKKTDKEQVLIDNDDYTFVIYGITDPTKGNEEANIYGYFENKTDATLNLDWRNRRVNGTDADDPEKSFFTIYGANAHTKNYVTGHLNLKNCGLSSSKDIEDLSFSLVIDDMTDVYNMKEVYNADVTLEPVVIQKSDLFKAD